MPEAARAESRGGEEQAVAARAVSPLLAPALPRGLDPAGVLALQRAAGNRAVGRLLSRRSAPAAPSPLVVARSPLVVVRDRPPALVLARDPTDDEEDAGQQTETWGEWGWRQAKNPWVWVGIGITAIATVAYLKRAEIGEALAPKLIEHPEIVATMAKAAGPDRVADFVGPRMVTALEEAAGRSLADATAAEHVADAGWGLVKLIPGGGFAKVLYKAGSAAMDENALRDAGLEVGKQLGPQFIGQVAKKVAVDHGGEIVLHGVDAAAKDLFASAYWVYTDPRSMWA